MNFSSTMKYPFNVLLITSTIIISNSVQCFLLILSNYDEKELSFNLWVDFGLRSCPNWSWRGGVITGLRVLLWLIRYQLLISVSKCIFITRCCQNKVNCYLIAYRKFSSMIELLKKIVCQLYIKMISFLKLVFRCYYNRRTFFEMIDQYFCLFIIHKIKYDIYL